jgi:hypothetical protein
MAYGNFWNTFLLTRIVPVGVISVLLSICSQFGCVRGSTTYAVVRSPEMYVATYKTVHCHNRKTTMDCLSPPAVLQNGYPALTLR